MEEQDELVEFDKKPVGNVEEEEEVSKEVVKTPFSPNDFELQPMTMNMGDLIDMIKEEWIVFETDYQRTQNLWTPVQQCRLIESILLGLRLPAFYFEEVSKHKWNIIDGLQRCCAIRNFCVKESMVLNDLEFLGAEFENKHFSEFEYATRRDIRMQPITVNLLKSGMPDMVKYILFKRLNTGGISLTSQEIRNAVYSGPVIQTIQEMAKSEPFIKATDEKIETKRKTDMDFVSRFVAFYVQRWEDYEPSLERFINESMETMRKQWTEADRDEMAARFKDSMNLSYDLFGNRAFRRQRSWDERRTPLNKAYFEVISVLLAKLDLNEQQALKNNKDLLVENMCCAMRDSPTYRNAHSGGTGDKNAVRTRFSWMKQIIASTLNNKKIHINDNKIVTD